MVAQQTQTVLTAIEAGITAHARQGSEYMPERLGMFLERLVENSPAVGIDVRAGDGDSVLSGGDISRLGVREDWSRPRAGAAWREHEGAATFFMRVDSFDHGHEHDPQGRGPARGRGGRGREWWSELPPGPYELIVVVDVTDMNRQIRDAGFQHLAAWVLAVVVIALGYVAYSSWQSRRGLETQLLLARETAAHQARLAGMGAGLTHETKNPLGVVRGVAQSIVASDDASPDVKRKARDIIDEVDRTVGQINSFLSLARPQEPEPVVVELDRFFGDLLPLLQAEAEPAGVTFAYERAGLRVTADEGMLRRAVLNLAINAVRACHERAQSGQVRIMAERKGGSASLRVSDNGCGIAPEDVPRVTEPYFSRFRDGSGLGLAIVDDIARAHGWSLRFDSVPGRGTDVTLENLQTVG